MRINKNSSGPKTPLNLNIGLIEETSKPSRAFRNYTPREGNTENNPERALLTNKSFASLLSPTTSRSQAIRDKLHTTFTKYESSLALNKGLTSVKSSSGFEALSTSINTLNSTQPKRPRILSKARSLNTAPLMSQFKALKVLGKGRFGNVSMVRHLPTGAIYAIKDISTEKMTPKLEQRLLAEIKIQTFLDHDHCLQLFKCFNEGKHLYLVLQLGEQSLFDILRKKRYLTEVETAYYLKQVISALLYMHSHGVIHRDLKPENIIIINGVAKLGDFGWATYTPQEKRTTFCGTLDYVSPEIVTGEFYDQMVDVWSLCTGQAPFESRKSREETYKKILGVDLKFPKHLSSLVQDFIGRLLVRDPNQRMTLEEALQHEWLRLYEMEG